MVYVVRRVCVVCVWGGGGERERIFVSHGGKEGIVEYRRRYKDPLPVPYGPRWASVAK